MKDDIGKFGHDSMQQRIKEDNVFWILQKLACNHLAFGDWLVISKDLCRINLYRLFQERLTGARHIRTFFCTSSKAYAMSDLRRPWRLIRPIAWLRATLDPYWPKLISILVFSLRSTNSKPTWVLPRPTSRADTKSCKNVLTWLNSSEPTFLDPSTTMNTSCFLCEHFLDPAQYITLQQINIA